MRDDLTGLLEKADLALGSAAGVVAEESIEPLIQMIRTVRARLSYPEEILVVALAGGTGSGKSSLFNAMAGEDLVETGGVRPTTSHPAVAVPESAGATMDGYVAGLGIAERHSHPGPPICLIDLPDTDSVEQSHRLRVDRVLPMVDVVVWVTDPEKYRDARLHHEYLTPLAPYAGQFLFVLNQMDRLDQAEVEQVASDLHEALTDDGFRDPVVLTVAADPPVGPPMGIEDLYAALEDRRQSRALYGKVLTDLAEATRDLDTRTGTGLDFDARARAALDSAVRAMTAGDTTAANRELTALLDALAEETGGSTAEKLERLGSSVSRHVDRIAGEATEKAEPRRTWPWSRKARQEVVDGERARALLSEAVIRPARAVVAKRAVAIAAVAELAVEVERLRQSADR